MQNDSFTNEGFLYSSSECSAMNYCLRFKVTREEWSVEILIFGVSVY